WEVWGRDVIPGTDPGSSAHSNKMMMGTEGDNIQNMFGEKPLMYEDIPHWGMNLRSPNEIFTVSEYQAYADQKILEITKRGNLPILVGGTGLYVAAVVDRPSFAEVPPDPALRLELATKTNTELLEEIAERDPDTAERIDTKNRRRLERAIEILRATGKRLAEVQTRGEPIYNVCMVGIEVPRETLYKRIDARIDTMISEGLVDEVRALKEKYGDTAPGMTGIGYRQICAFLRGECTLRDAIIVLKHDTHQYAKRQLTWFQRDKRIHWVKNTHEALEITNSWIK
ncbi:MAG: tRNA (adenosine(37)-N6)-dimethylallyltransferase MiaA, partial [Patescibacteria group bacterium]